MIFRRRPVTVPPVPQGLDGIVAYSDETAAMINAQWELIGNPFKWRQFYRNDRVISARLRAASDALDVFDHKLAQGATS